MNKTTLFLLVGVLVLLTLIAGFIYYPPKNSIQNPLGNLAPKEIKPSETFIDYTDPSGFSFSYPDNLSILNVKAQSEVDSNSYADLQLFSKDKNGSLTIRIEDSELASLNDWLKANNIPSSTTPVEKKLGGLEGLEVKTGDRLMLASLDQGVLFTIESPLIEQDFWSKVYDKVLKDFTFASPAADNSEAGSSSSSDEVTFEGEEVIE